MKFYLSYLPGSNSVNVFLGLGLPWVIKTIYYKVKGKDVKVIDSNLTFSVTVFLCCGIVCLMFLVLRRKVSCFEFSELNYRSFCYFVFGDS